MSEYKIANVDEDLKPFPLRGIRQVVLDRLEERISNRYNPARPLIVVPEDGTDKYLVADGNHRLEVLKKLGINEVPILVQSGNPYSLGVQANEDENTYAPMDVFDWLEIIGKLRGEGYKQREIAETIGWSRDRVKNFLRLIDNIGTEVLDFCKNHQEGRVPESGTNVPKFNFTEGWFRDSGIYDLPVVKVERDSEEIFEELRSEIEDVVDTDEADNIINTGAYYEDDEQIWTKAYDDRGNDYPVGVDKYVERNRQQELIDWFLKFIEDKNRAPGHKKVQEKVRRLLEKEECIKYLDENLLNTEKYDEFLDTVEDENFSSLKKFKQSVDYENEKYQEEQKIDIRPTGDFRELCKEIEDNSIDLILTDPPYGKEYIELWESLGEIANRILKPGGFLLTYSGKLYLQDVMISLSKNLHYYWTLALKHTGSTMLFKPRKMMEGWKPVIVYNKPPNADIQTVPDLIEGNKDKEFHEWSQSIPEAKKLIKYFSEKGDTVLDPMAGSGTILLAALEEDRRVIGIDNDEKAIKTIRSRLQEYFSEVNNNE